MSTTLQALRRRVSREMREPFVADIPAGFINPVTGSTTTVIRTGLSGLWTTADEWVGGYVYFASGDNAGEERRITDYDETTGYLTVAPAFSNAPATTDEVEIHSRTSATEKNSAINAALAAGWPQFWTLQTTEMAMPKDRTEITSSEGLPTTWRYLAELWIEPAWRSQTAEETATSGTTTTLTLTGAGWTVNQYAGYTVSIIDGTGVGQERTVASNTADTLTVSSAFTTAPDSTTVFVLKDPRDDGVWARLAEVRPITGQYLERIIVPRWLQHRYGRTLRLIGVTEPATLEDEDDTTNVPSEYVVWAAVGQLSMQRGFSAPSKDWDAEQFIGRYSDEKAREARQRYAFAKPPRTIWQPPSERSLYTEELDPLNWGQGML